MKYIRDQFAFTSEADAWFRGEIRKWAAAKKSKPAAPKKAAMKAAGRPVKKPLKKPVKKPEKKEVEKAPVFSSAAFAAPEREAVHSAPARGKTGSPGWLVAAIGVAAIVLAVVFFPNIKSLFKSSGTDRTKSAQDTVEFRKNADETAPEVKQKFQSYKPAAHEKEGYDYYTVKSRESLVTISAGLTGKYWDCQKLYLENKNIIMDANTVFAGQIIRIPDSMKKGIKAPVH